MRIPRQVLCVVAAALFVVAPGAIAHPHLRFAYQIGPVLEEGRLAGLRVLWQMDPLTTMLVARGIDANRNGEVDPEELDAFASENRRLLAASGYFLQVTQNGRALAFSIAAPLRAELAEGRIALSFEVRLDAPAAPDALGVRFFDETWYVALLPAEPVLAGSAPCTVVAHSRTLATQSWGEQPVPTIGLTCTDPS